LTTAIGLTPGGSEMMYKCLRYEYIFNDHYSSSAFHPKIFSYTLMRICHGFAATSYYNNGEMRKTEVKDVTY